jgi:hypothetical protein
MAVRTVGRLLQLGGLIVLPISLMAELSEFITLKGSLLTAGFGVILFVIGYLVAGIAGDVDEPTNRAGK